MRSYIVLILMVFATAAGMAQIPTPVPYNPALTGKSAAAPGASDNASTSGLLGTAILDPNYKLRVGDTVSFQIREDIVWNPTDAPKSLVVSDSGELDVPYIGRVQVTDKTCKEVAGEIETNLEKDYYNKATVVMSVNLANKLLGRIYITGQVRSPGPMEIQVNENLTAGQAILRAGGFGDFANKSKVLVIRGGAIGSTAEKQTFPLDMQQILDKGKMENDILLQPGDYIIVPSRLINF